VNEGGEPKGLEIETKKESDEFRVSLAPGGSGQVQRKRRRTP
jgi:hypothetical protein